MSGPTRFQARTIAYVIKRFWLDPQPAKRFLVADEVGLGKTIVAREVIAHALGARNGQAIDIVYLCSSQPVASQNLKRLVVHGHGGNGKATRLTLLALEKPSSEGIRYFALTPDTSFKVSGRSGLVRERALIFHCLRSIFRSPGFQLILQQVSDQTWKEALWKIGSNHIDGTVKSEFRKAVSADTDLAAAVRALARDAVNWKGPTEQRTFKKRRDVLIGRLRKELALCSAKALASNGMVIVDEFQKFSQLLDVSRADADFGVRLADQLLGQDAQHRRVLLLSATPYRMPGGAIAEGERPYTDFVALVRFLAGAKTAVALSDHLDHYAGALRATSPDPTAILSARDAACEILRSIMCRTERTASTADANAMVAEDIRSEPVEADDLKGALAARQIARRLKVRDPVEYWKSAPYFLDFMRDYQFRDAVTEVETIADRRHVARQAKSGKLLLDKQLLRRLEPLHLPSPRMRDLVRDVLKDGAERLLWVPPSLPYHEPAGVFAKVKSDVKRLVFSEWRLAPDAISALVSYETEQRLAAGMRGSRGKRTRRSEEVVGQRHKRFGDLGNMLRLGRAHQAAGDPTLAMVPLLLLTAGSCLSSWGDPLPVAAKAGSPIARDEHVRLVADTIRSALRKLPGGTSTGRIDDRWYWAAPLLLEDQDLIRRWMQHDDPFMAAFETSSADLERVRDAIIFIVENPDQLGRRPRNLVNVLARIAVCAPGQSAYRSLTRSWGGQANSIQLLRAAFHIGRGFQSLFNQAEAAAAVQLEFPGRRRVFWDQALEYCAAGNLQALLDEHLHFEADALAMFDGTADEKVERAAKSLHAAMTLKRASIDVRGLERRGGSSPGAKNDFIRLRCRHAIRFAEIKDSDGSVSRLDAVRAAFNSPFRPFILASTAVGQEGLDFHPWCHAVIHWNLPRSPVELEQREGRVHRYKGHAVRLNVASYVSLAGLSTAPDHVSTEPWKQLFAKAEQLDSDNPLAPCWLFEPDHEAVKIKRIVSYPAFSREQDYWPRLRERLATYRLVIGLPRQEDLLEAIERNGITPEQAAAWKIDLSPPEVRHCYGARSP
ncbi:DEAD/DEAH box helicase [Rhizobium leguminosarum]